MSEQSKEELRKFVGYARNKAVLRWGYTGEPCGDVLGCVYLVSENRLPEDKYRITITVTAEKLPKVKP